MHFLSRAYINIIYSVQIYNKKLNCANAQQLFCTKTKKKLDFVSLFEKL